MQDRPTARELLESVERFLERDVVPALDGPKQFHARVAANLMRVVGREIELGPRFLREEWRRLGELAGEGGELPPDGAALAEEVSRLTQALCERIRSGDADRGPWREKVLAHVRRTVEEKLEIANPKMLKRGLGLAKATFAGGCFWGVEETFRHVPGVASTRVGYCGGTFESPSYGDVCSGRTGHAESVEVDYDPSRISYERLLEIFWECHDPTTLDRQGPDVGEQYRSAIFFHGPEQQAAALTSKDERRGRYRRPIVTQIVPASTFYPAEEYHQQYFEKHGRCRMHPSGARTH